MLIFYLGRVSPVLDFPQMRFDAEYEPDWLENEFGRKVVREIDRSEVISGGRSRGGGVIDSPVFGSIPPRELSTGTRTLLLIANSEKYKDYWFPQERMGDNVIPYLIEAASFVRHDIKIRASYIPHIPWDSAAKITILPINETVSSYADFVLCLSLHSNMLWKGEGYRGY
jgi:hypothetical protein